MTHPSKITKAELLAQVAEYDEALALVSDERDALSKELGAAQKRIAESAPHRVPEADALAGCIRALDEMIGRRDRNQRPNFGYSDPSYVSPEAETVDRILRSLASKYGVRLIDTELCRRPHVDDIEPGLLASAMRGAVIPR